MKAEDRMDGRVGMASGPSWENADSIDVASASQAGTPARRVTNRRDFLRTSALAAAALPFASLSGGVPPLAAATVGPEGAGVALPGSGPRWPGYDAAMVIDCLGGPGAPGFREAGGLSAASLEGVRRSGVTAVNLTVGVVGGGDNLLETTLRDIGYWEREIAAHPDYLLKVRTTADLDEAKASGRLGIIYGFQDAIMLEGDASRVGLFHDLGVRIVQLTYNLRNDLGDGSMMAENRGLTDFGREVVGVMNERRMLVDLSHCGHRTTREGIDASSLPVAITHSGCTALADLPRNKPDAVLKAMADRGGVVGIYFMPFLREVGQPMAADVIAHIERAWDVCGEDHVGIGTDGGINAIQFDEDYRRRHREDIANRRARGISAPGETEDVYTFIPDLNDERRLEMLADMLAGRGHSATRIEKLLGGNFYRLFGEVWG